jgi:phosphate:Na+ symporter
LLTQHTFFGLLIGGVAIFMYGMTIASESLQKLMANRVKALLGRLENSSLIAIVVGMLLTILLQSSGAVTSMLVGLGSAGVVTLPQVMGIIIGTAVGTTFIVQLISFNAAQYGLGIFAFAFFVYFLSKKTILKEIMGVLMGFGLIFIGIEWMGMASNEVRHIDWILDFFSFLKVYPFLTLLATAMFTAFVHSSAVAIGMAMTLAAGGIIDLNNAIYWVLGANIGTTSTALMASLGGNHVGRQVAWSHFFYKALSVLAFCAIAEPFVQAVAVIDSQPSRAIANAHTFYNVFSAMIFFPFIGIGAKLIQKIFTPSEKDAEFGVQYLDRDFHHSPELALGYAKREILRMGDLVIDMFKDSITLFERIDTDLAEDLVARDNQVDLLYREIQKYLVRFSSELPDKGDESLVALISFTSDLESAADVIVKNIVAQSNKLHRLKVSFSQEGWQEIQEMHSLVLKSAEMSLACFQTRDRALAAKLIQKKRELRFLEERDRASHVGRLNLGLKDTINTTTIHLDLLSELRRISGLFTNHAYRHLSKEEVYRLLPDQESK